MNEILTGALAWLAGAMLGVIFFGGLWWTIRKGISSPRPALWFFASLLIRMSIALGGFYIVGHAYWERLLLCLLGFVMVRLVVTRLARPAEANPPRQPQEASHAP